jgi:hypothetical protein
MHVDFTFPVFYALMSRKTTELYKAVMQKLNAIAPEFSAVFGTDMMVSGCWFHYAQALIKRLKKIGLSDAYKNEETTQVVCRCLLALPLLPVNDIYPGFQDVKILVQDDSPSKSQLVQLCHYVERYWIQKSSIGVARMSVRDNPARTNNAVESFHAALRRCVKVAHSNLYTFLGHLQRATTDCEADIARLNRGMSIRRSKKRTNLVNEARIKACIARFDSGAYTRVQFLRAVSHNVGAHAVPENSADADDSEAQDDDNDEVGSVSNIATVISLRQLLVHHRRRSYVRSA